MKYQQKLLSLFLLAGMVATPVWAAKKPKNKTAETVQTMQPRLTNSTGLTMYQKRDTSQQQTSDWIIAVVNSDPITYQEMQARLVRIELQLLNAGQALPDRAELYQQLLQKMIDDRAQVQEAKAMGIRVDDASVQQALQNMAAQSHVTEAQLLERLRADGVSIAQLRNDLRDELLLDKVHEYQASQAKVSDSELDTFIAAQKKALAEPDNERINLAQLLVAVPEGASEAKIAELRKKADDLAKRAEHEDFAILVKYSDAQKANAGAMGLRPVSEYPDVFAKAAAKLRPGQVSAPIRSEAGFHILRLLDRQGASLADSVVQTLVRHIIIKPAAGETEQQVVAQMRQLKADIQSGKISFEAAAGKYSQDGSALKGGSLGWSEPGQFVPEFENAMNGLPAGQISDPIASRFGVHLIEVQERQRVRVDAKQQRELARRSLQQERGEENYKNWAEGVRARAFVELRAAPEAAAKIAG
jgi:peptidyl-prolyl cis-trans isomerase SurA